MTTLYLLAVAGAVFTCANGWIAISVPLGIVALFVWGHAHYRATGLTLHEKQN